MITPARKTFTSAVQIHHCRARYTSSGNVVVKNRPTARHDPGCAPVIAERPASTIRDSRATSAGSGERLRITDRCVAVRWYNAISSSASSADSFRRAESCSSRRHSPPCSVTYASRSTARA